MKNSIHLSVINLLLAASSLSAATHYVSLESTNPTPPYAVMANSASNLLATLPATQLSGTVGNAQLANSSVTVTGGAGLVGGGTVPLGGAVIVSNTGVLSVTGNADVTASIVDGARYPLKAASQPPSRAAARRRRSFTPSPRIKCASNAARPTGRIRWTFSTALPGSSPSCSPTIAALSDFGSRRKTSRARRVFLGCPT
ncbi:MAG TPA: hypothetical protein VMU04_10980 [Candidatus Acidoferrum sp.]|nr:hypothetical protein [Candidatus Acidoferrum sp.]